MTWLKIFALSTIAGLSFCFIFSVRPRNMIVCALFSGMTWTSLQYLQSLGVNSVFATLISGFLLGIGTEIAAVKLKSPAINFIIIGFIVIGYIYVPVSPVLISPVLVSPVLIFPCFFVFIYRI